MPASIAADYLLNRYLLPWEAYLGIALVIGGFVMMNVAEQLQERAEMKQRREEALQRALSNVESLVENDSFDQPLEQ